MTVHEQNPQRLDFQGTGPPSPTATSGSRLSVTVVPDSPASQRVPESPHGKHCDVCRGYTKTPYDDNNDPADDLEQPLHGWPEVAKLMAKYPGFEAFPTFKDLQLKSLLYYQAELVALRRKLHELEWEDHRNSDFKGAEVICKRVDKLLICGAREKDPDARKQMELVTKIRTVLKDYNGALLQYSQTMALPKADGFNVNSLRTWLEDSRFGNRNIAGPGSESWGHLGFHERETHSIPSLIKQFFLILWTLFWPGKPKENDLDLVVPRAGHKYDRLAKWVADDLVPFWEKVKAPRVKSEKSDEEAPNAQEEKQQPIQSKQRTSKASPFSYTKQKQKKEKNESFGEGPENAFKGRLTLNEYSESSILLFTSFVATLIACLLPIVGIAVLSKLHKQPEMIGLIAVFTFLFAIGVMFLTGGASKVEVFTATAAFSAVLVVFVQNQN